MYHTAAYIVFRENFQTIYRFIIYTRFCLNKHPEALITIILSILRFTEVPF